MATADKSKKRRKESLTADEKLNRNLTYKRKFRAVVRLVLANLHWLQEVESHELGDSVKKNFLMIIKKGKGKTMLSLKEKALLRKPVHLRTAEDINILYTVVGGIKCFQKYNDQVKRQLAGKTYFEYYGPDRYIVRQNHEGLKLFFIFDGKVGMYQESVDPATDEPTTISIGTMEKGDMFGEVSLLHGVARPYSVYTTDHCEFLTLTKGDFDEVLKRYVQKEWNAIYDAMNMFRYFDRWNAVTKQECCIISKIQQHDAGVTLVGDDLGPTEYTFFLLQGRCKLVESLYFTLNIEKGIKYLERYYPADNVEPVQSESILKASKTQLIYERSKNENLQGSFRNLPQTQSVPKIDDRELPPNETQKPSESSIEIETEEEKEFDGEVFFRTTITEAEAMRNQRLTIAQEAKAMSAGSTPAYVEKYYMQICFFNELSCFSIGEYLDNRRIIAITPVKVLAIPRYFLFDKNVGNIWNKIKQFLNLKIPSTDMVYKEFKDLRRWSKHCKNMKMSIIKDSGCCYSNNICNVPYYHRINDKY